MKRVGYGKYNLELLYTNVTNRKAMFSVEFVVVVGLVRGFGSYGSWCWRHVDAGTRAKVQVVK